MSNPGKPAANQSPALQYIALAREALARVRQDRGAIIKLANRMAAPLLAGGNIWTPQVAEWFFNEFNYRAGGLMGLRRQGYEATCTGKDVALFALPDVRQWDPRQDKLLKDLMAGPAQLYVVGRKEDLAVLGRKGLARFSGFTGGATADEGLHAFEQVRPLCPLRQFEMLVRGWTLMGEMIAACTRGGRMPVIWMSVWMEGAHVRNHSLVLSDNLREPWNWPLFHERQYVPPLPQGYAFDAFLAEVERIVAVIQSQHAALAKAGRWMAHARRTGKKLCTVCVGHSYPRLLERPKDGRYPIEWGNSVSDLARAVPPVYVRRILDRGIKFIYSTPYGRGAADAIGKQLPSHPNLLWLDLPWRPADQSIDIPGYSVRMCPTSSSVHTVTYFAILSELATRMGW